MGEGGNVPRADEEKRNKSSSSDETRPLQLAILGRQNVGKSTLVNALLGSCIILRISACVSSSYVPICRVESTIVVSISGVSPDITVSHHVF